MDHRLFFVVGDFLANLAVGVIVAAIAWWLVPFGANMWFAMFAMMALGMVVGLIFFFPVGMKLGAMEVMIPVMYSGMWSGMMVGMVAAMTPLHLGHALALGAACGVAEITFIWIVNTLLRGVTREADGA